MPTYFRRRARVLLQRLGLLNLAWKTNLLASAVLSFPRNRVFWKNGTGDNLPIPPLSYIACVTGSCDVGWFLESGKSALNSMIQLLHRNGLKINDFQNILDFGCGCGRVVRHLKESDVERIDATDMNPELIQWCSRNLKFAHFQQNDLCPPLKFPDKTFDFVFALSVFTHLSEDLQLPWMHELSRVLSDGGCLILTTHSSRDAQGRLSDRERQRYNAGEVVIQGKDLPGSNLCTAYHSLTFVRERLTEGFSIVDFLEEGAKGNPFQSIFLLTKPAK